MQPSLSLGTDGELTYPLLTWRSFYITTNLLPVLTKCKHTAMCARCSQSSHVLSDALQAGYLRDSHVFPAETTAWHHVETQGYPRRYAELLLGPSSQASSLLTCHAVLLTKTLVHCTCDVLRGIPVLFLQTPSPLLPRTCHAIEVIIGESSPPWLDLSAPVFPLTLSDSGMPLVASAP